jgi:hypothetical protein
VIELFAGFKISASADRVWRLVNWTGVSELCGTGTFFRGVRFSSTDPAPGALRIFTPSEAGPQITELLLYYDESLRFYGYRVVDAGDLPLADYEGRVCVTPAGSDACLLSFSARGIPVGISVRELQDFYAHAEKQIANAIAQRLGARVLN